MRYIFIIGSLILAVIGGCGRSSFRGSDVKPPIPPDTFLSSVPTNLSKSASAIFYFYCNKETCIYECALDGGTWEACISPKTYTGLKDGSHTFSVRARYRGGNVDATPATYSWIVDTFPPNTAVISGPFAFTNDTSSTFVFTSSEPGSTFECRLDTAEYVSCTLPRTYTGLIEGNHIFSVRAIDPAGNVDPTPAIYLWSIDTTPPDTSIIAGPNSLTNQTSATFSFTSIDGSTFECRIDSGVYGICSSPMTYIGLSEGNYTFSVRARDLAGNVDPTPDTYSWTISFHWRATSIIEAPTKREFHTAVWTGSEMIIWGGHSGVSLTNSGGKYNPITDIWLATSTLGAPEPRCWHTAVWTGNEMIVWGGPITYSGGKYSPTTDSWQATTFTDVPSGRYSHSAVWTGTEMIVWGGWDGNLLNTGGRYTP